MNDTSNDFESRARAAGRAARHVVDDVPAVTALAPRRSRGPIRAVAIAAAVVLVAAIGAAMITTDHAERSSASPETITFCAAIRKLSGRPSQSNQTPPRIASAPREIRAAYQARLDLLRNAFTSADLGRAQITLAVRFQNWFEINCFTDAAQPDAPPKWQRFGPIGSGDGIEVCGIRNASAAPEGRPPDSSIITIYGDGRRADPYDGPLVGLTANSDLVLGHGAAVAIAAPGAPPTAEISDMADPFGQRVPDARTIQWGDASNTFALTGRRISGDIDGTLARLAGRVTFTDGKASVAADALPAAWRVLYSGPTAAVDPSAAFPPQQTFTVIANHGDLTLTGAILSPQAAEALRFSIPNLQPGFINGRRALLSPDRNPRPRSIGRWVDGAITLTVIRNPTDGSSPLAINQVIRSTRALTRSEWESLVTETSTCYLNRLTLGRASAAGPAGSPSAAATTSPPTVSVP